MKMVSLTNLNQQIISNITYTLLVTAYFSSRNHDLFFIYIESMDIPTHNLHINNKIKT